MKEREELYFPTLRDVNAEWIGIVEAESAGSSQAALAAYRGLAG